MEKEKIREINESVKEIYEEVEAMAQEGFGCTEKEWDSLPDQYVGMCIKECHRYIYMRKGSEIEFGVRGVYVCDRCSYAYPPGCCPDPKSSRLAEKFNAISDKMYEREQKYKKNIKHSGKDTDSSENQKTANDTAVTVSP